MNYQTIDIHNKLYKIVRIIRDNPKWDLDILRQLWHCIFLNLLLFGLVKIFIPFWMVGHVHLMTTIYQDIHEIIMSMGMNIIVVTGFILDYKQQKQ
jgi:hypothetical protein